MNRSSSRLRKRSEYPLFRMGALAAACALVVAESGGAHAQQVANTSQDGKSLQTVTVTGIRASLDSAMNLKRDSQGVVDGINAEEIGKFPDTNLAESLQRISGVSIDRSIGEGSKVTVRGVGPDFNMVLLNGRQMPASSLGSGGTPSGRAFDFANLASEAVAGIEVFKTSRSSTPTGGIGATINIKTARPLDGAPVASFGFKEVIDTSNSSAPSHLQGKSATPEFPAFTAIHLLMENLALPSRQAIRNVALATTRRASPMGGVQLAQPMPMIGAVWQDHSALHRMFCTPHRRTRTIR